MKEKKERESVCVWVEGGVEVVCYSARISSSQFQNMSVTDTI